MKLWVCFSTSLIFLSREHVMLSSNTHLLTFSTFLRKYHLRQTLETNICIVSGWCDLWRVDSFIDVSRFMFFLNLCILRVFTEFWMPFQSKISQLSQPLPFCPLPCVVSRLSIGSCCSSSLLYPWQLKSRSSRDKPNTLGWAKKVAVWKVIHEQI